ncbi:MAG: hypothetical protein OEM22_06150, partial [Acidimicrobiia bacterium]|nr:hypothetical protein [Acidimicrobiia bacterium]
SQEPAPEEARMNQVGERPEFSTAQVWLRSALIVIYFVVASVIIPSRVIEAGFLSSSPGDLFSDDTWDIIRSLIGSGVWLAAFGLGVWGLRRLQQRDVI